MKTFLNDVRVVLILLGCLAVYSAYCWVFPSMRCKAADCEGGRVYQNEKKQKWRRCRRCGGSGERVRPGRQVLEFLFDRRAK